MRFSLGLVTTLLGLAVLSAASARAVQLNMPADIVGTWHGSCTQVETSTQTNVDALFELQSENLVLGSWVTQSSFFGCPAADPGGYPLFKGAKRDGFSAHKLYVKGHEQTQPWGIVTVKTVKGNTIVVKGRKACNGAGPKKYSGKGQVASGVFTFAMQGKIQGEIAHFTCSWTRAQ